MRLPRSTEQIRDKHAFAIQKVNFNNEAKRFILDLMNDVSDYERLLRTLTNDLRNIVDKLNSLQIIQTKKLNTESLPLHTLFGIGMKARMSLLGVSQARLEKETGISQRTLGPIIDGRTNVTSRTMERIAEALEATALDLIELGTQTEMLEEK